MQKSRKGFSSELQPHLWTAPCLKLSAGEGPALRIISLFSFLFSHLTKRHGCSLLSRQCARVFITAIPKYVFHLDSIFNNGCFVCFYAGRCVLLSVWSKCSDTKVWQKAYSHSGRCAIHKVHTVYTQAHGDEEGWQWLDNGPSAEQ